MLPIARAIEGSLGELVADALRQLDGVPEDDLNGWRPATGLHDINTFAALMTHLLGAAEYWTLEAVGGRALGRDREAEFRAQTTADDLRARAERWRENLRNVLADVSGADLARVPALSRRFSRTSAPGGDEAMTVADCLVHAVDHTATHVGHLHIQRQLWDAERGGGK